MARLLIVDDEKNIRLSLVRFFESLGHQVSEAENGARHARCSPSRASTWC